MKPKFLHITKTGGSSTKAIFGKQIEPIIHIRNVQDMDNVFTFVRNPYDRLVSLYFHGLGKKMITLFTDHAKKKNRYPAFEDFCLDLKNQEFVTLLNSKTHKYGFFGPFPASFRPMAENTRFEQKRVLRENVFKMEDFNKSIGEICAKFELTHKTIVQINKSQHEDFRSYYENPEVEQAVYSFYKEDFELFGYKRLV